MSCYLREISKLQDTRKKRKQTQRRDEHKYKKNDDRQKTDTRREATIRRKEKTSTRHGQKNNNATRTQLINAALIDALINALKS